MGKFLLVAPATDLVCILVIGYILARLMSLQIHDWYSGMVPRSWPYNYLQYQRSVRPAASVCRMWDMLLSS